MRSAVKRTRLIKEGRALNVKDLCICDSPQNYCYHWIVHDAVCDLLNCESNYLVLESELVPVIFRFMINKFNLNRCPIGLLSKQEKLLESCQKTQFGGKII